MAVHSSIYHLAVSHLPFFPAALPDETLSSRVSRFHIIEGNATFTATLRQLFGHPLSDLSKIVPKCIEDLAAKLPGEPSENAGALTSANTLLPLFSPFLGKANSRLLDRMEADTGCSVSRLPRHVVGRHGDSNLCIQCAVDDEREHGVAYWRRAHQCPGVSVCWRHRVRLISSCPTCSLPFQRKLRLLEVPWNACPNCKLDVTKAVPDRTVTDVEHAYAVYVHRMLQAALPPIPSDLLAMTYRAAIRARGYCWGNAAATAEFAEALITGLGEDFVQQVDTAYSAGRRTNWLRFSICDGVMDLPITRHLMVSMYLFGTPTRFMQAVEEANATPHTKPEGGKSRRTTSAEPVQAEHRKRVRVEMLRCPGIELEQLWRRAFTATAWLFEHDRAWLEAALQPKGRAATTKRPLGPAPQEEDKRFADLVASQARAVISLKTKPERVTIQRLLENVPAWKVDTLARRSRYPLLSEQLVVCKESSWCFSARRILWSLGELIRLELPVTIGNVSQVSAVSAYAVAMITRFTQWDLAEMSARSLNIPHELGKVGIGPSWAGPESTPMGTVGGRAYVRKRQRAGKSAVDVEQVSSD
nr:TnsD family Tn7-like transposition protein [Massilia solisilvae]